MPLCVSEAAFFENPAWLKVGFELLQWLATFSRDYLLPKLKSSFAVFEKKMAEYADVVAVSAAILQRAGIPAIAQGFWTEHSERAVLPTGLSVLGVMGPLQDWLKERHSLSEETAAGSLKCRGIAAIVGMSWGPLPRRYHGLRTGGLSMWWSSSPERYSDCTDRGLKGVGWGGGRSFEIVKNTLASPIRPSTPMFVVYVGRAAEKGKTRLARPPQPSREMGRR